MKDLIERLERATGPNFDLDREIMYAHYSTAKRHRTPGDRPPAYTASIDAALMLVPEGWSWSIRDGGCYATGKLLGPHAELAEPIETQFGPGVGTRAQIDAATPALALCIAALKARS